MRILLELKPWYARYRSRSTGHTVELLNVTAEKELRLEGRLEVSGFFTWRQWFLAKAPAVTCACWLPAKEDDFGAMFIGLSMGDAQ